MLGFLMEFKDKYVLCIPYKGSLPFKPPFLCFYDGHGPPGPVIGSLCPLFLLMPVTWSFFISSSLTKPLASPVSS